MPTPATYNQQLLGQILDANRDKSLFHCTRIGRLESILACGAIYSLGTVWAIVEGARENINSRYSNIQAEAGFIDYVFMSTTNRHAFGITNTIHGRIGLEFDNQVLSDRDFFVYPFNVGFDWNDSKYTTQKLSDLTTVRGCLQSVLKNIEFLVRRKVSLTYLRRVHCFGNDEKEVCELLNRYGLKAAVVTYAQDGELAGVSPLMRKMSFSNDIVLAGNPPARISREHLVTFQGEQNRVVQLDPSSNCLREFLIEGVSVLNTFDRTLVLGSVDSGAADSTG